MKLGIVVGQKDQIKMVNAILELCTVDFIYNSELSQLYFQIEDKYYVPIAQLIRDRFSNSKNIIALE